MLALADVPALIPSPRRSIHDPLYPLPVVALLGLNARRQVLAQHVGFDQEISARFCGRVSGRVDGWAERRKRNHL